MRSAGSSCRSVQPDNLSIYFCCLNVKGRLRFTRFQRFKSRVRPCFSFRRCCSLVALPRAHGAFFVWKSAKYFDKNFRSLFFLGVFFGRSRADRRGPRRNWLGFWLSTLRSRGPIFFGAWFGSSTDVAPLRSRGPDFGMTFGIPRRSTRNAYYLYYNSVYYKRRPAEKKALCRAPRGNRETGNSQTARQGK